MKIIKMNDFEERFNELRNAPFMFQSMAYYNILHDYEDKNLLLINFISIIRDFEDLVFLGMLLRFELDVNQYIEIKGTRKREHLLSRLLTYLDYHRAKSNLNNNQFASLKRMIIVMLLMTNLDPSLPRFKECSNMYGCDVENYESLQLWLGRSEWLRNVNGELVPLGKTVDLLTPSEVSDLRLYLDFPPQEGFQENLYTIEAVIHNRAANILSKSNLFYYYHSSHLGGYTRIWYYLIKSCWSEGLDNFLSLGYNLKYTDVNLIITELMSPLQTSLNIQVLISMLNSALNMGTFMDSYQLKTLEKITSIDNSVRQSLIKTYNQPFLIKAKNSLKGEIPERLIKYAFICNLSLEKSKQELINSLQRISESDREEIIQACRDRFNTRITTEFNNFLDFAKPGEIKAITLSGVHTSGIDPWLIGDHQIIVLEAEDENYYCFSSDYFIPLLKDKGILLSVNTKKPMEVPLQAKIKIESKLKLLESFNINPTEIIPIIDILKELNKEDKISPEETNKKIVIMKNVFSGLGINTDIFETYPEAVKKINEIFIKLNLRLEELDKLDITHLWATFYHEMYALFVNIKTRPLIDSVVIPIMRFY